MRWPSLLKRETPPPTSAMESQIGQFWAETFGAGFFSPRMVERVWVANRCIQLNAQQIASMPLRFSGSFEPAWVANPDPAWYPNGIGDAVFAIVRSLYGWGDAFLHITSRYASGLPSAWTVLDPAVIHVEMVNGRRSYRAGEVRLDPDRVVQISRDPGGGLRGTSALRAYASQAMSAVAAGQLSQSVHEGGVPTAVIKSQRKLTREQAEQLQQQWVEATAMRRGFPAILPPELDFEPLSFSPKDLLLLEAQEFNARVIATAFGVPASLLNMSVSGGLTYQNPALLGELWWRFELRPTAKRVADALTARLLPRGNAVVFDASDTFAALDDSSSLDDSQTESVSASAGDVRQLRPVEART